MTAKLTRLTEKVAVL